MRAVAEVGKIVRLVRISPVIETAAVDAPVGSPPFLNMVATAWTTCSAHSLVVELLAIERRLGRVRRGPRNAPRTIDIDLILYSAVRTWTPQLTLPHPRAASRAFVLEPLRACSPALAAALLRMGGT